MKIDKLVEHDRKYDIQTHFKIYYMVKVTFQWGKRRIVLGQVANHFEKQKAGFFCYFLYLNKFKMYFKIPEKTQINLHVILEWKTVF